MDSLKKQVILIDSRQSFVCDTVEDVEEFSQEYVLINTGYGKLNVEGEELRIKELNEKEGKISITGKITGLFFKDEREKSGFFKRKK